jgi:uncharacterized protein
MRKEIAYQKQRLRSQLGFDLEAPRTYYTRPMSPPWSKPLDIDRLADGEADIDFAVPLAELPRLRAQLASVAGMVRGRVHFTRESGLAVADLTVSGAATLACQRCLQAMTEPVSSSVRVALIATEADASRVAEHLEPVLALGGRITVGELVEEELLLALPIVPLHAQASDCAVPVDVAAASGVPQTSDVPEQTTQKPFAQLDKLLKR